MAKLRYGAVVGLLSSMTLGSTVHVPPTFLNGSISMENFSVAGNLDGSKMTTAANKTSFDFWYFDAMSTSDDAAINIVFFNTDNLKSPSPLAVQISGTFPNDTQFSGQTLASDGADIRNDEHGVSGNWSGAGASFRGTNLEDANAEYEITFDAPSIGLEGTVKLQSVSSFHSWFSLPAQRISYQSIARSCPLPLRLERPWRKPKPPSTSLLGRRRPRRRCRH